MKKVLCFILTVLLIAPLLPVKLVFAAETTVTIHYQREDEDYEKWNLWIWAEGKDGAAYPFTDEDGFGKYATVTLPVEAAKVGFIVRTDAWEKDFSDDRFIDVAAGIDEIWVTTGKTEYETEAPEGYEKQLPAFDNLNVVAHYFRYDNDYKNISLEFDEKVVTAGNSKTLALDQTTKNGVTASFTLKNIKEIQKIKFKIKKGESYDSRDHSITVSNADANGNIEVFFMQGMTKVGYKETDINTIRSVVSAKINSLNEISVEVSVPILINNGDYTLTDGTNNILIDKIEAVNPAEDGYTKSVKITTKEDLLFTSKYTLDVKDYSKVPVTLGNVYDSDAFSNIFTYTGNDLGCIYSEDSTSFKLWAPTSEKAYVLFYIEGLGGEVIERLPMTMGDNGVWSATALGDYKNKFYTYEVTVAGETNEAADPYAKAVGVNGDRGMVVDLKSTNPEGFDNDTKPEFINATDAIIYELHVRDMSISDNSGISNKGKFLGIVETGTKNSNGDSTGLDHLKNMGITHLHLLPSFDFQSIDETKLEENNFNWGYDPKNYNVPEGSYSSDPYSGTVRITEFKQMVQKLHENGIRVVMDVVYNHTGATENSNLNLLVPDYYYRKTASDDFSNGSGCGNETASERSMVRKFIVDSVVYWATEYHIDGFRFDLMALHDIDTMNEVSAALHKIDPNILIYGEGWTGASTTLPPSEQALKSNVSKLDNIAVFSDDIRDGIKGSVFDFADKGFANGAEGKEAVIKFGVVGSIPNAGISGAPVAWAKEPHNTVTYVSAHDNNTLWDKISLTNPDESEEERIKIDLLSAAIVFTSQGIPFLHAGEEMLRTKGNNDNSYNSPDSVNQLDWDRLTKYKSVYEYYNGLIAFRKAHPALRMTAADDIRKNLSFLDMPDANMVGFKIDNNANNDSIKTLLVMYNANNEDKTVSLEKGKWAVYAEGDKISTEAVKIINGKYVIPARSMLLLGDAKSSGISSYIAVPITIAVTAAALVCAAFIILRKKKTN